RYHGFYVSTDGVTWTRLLNQPGSGLSTGQCPAHVPITGSLCPIYRGELAVVAGRNEMYAWYVSLDASGAGINQGIWKSLDGGASWAALNTSGIDNCGDLLGCGVDQGGYNLELAAVPDGLATDVYAGAVNLYKCIITSISPTCGGTG